RVTTDECDSSLARGLQQRRPARGNPISPKLVSFTAAGSFRICLQHDSAPDRDGTVVSHASGRRRLREVSERPGTLPTVIRAIAPLQAYARFQLVAISPQGGSMLRIH